MSNKRIKLSENRDSFSARFCDDLCEVLLSYLSLEDKIRFECVSKQWKRLIFNKQFVIKLNCREHNGINNLNKLINKCKNNPNDEEIDVKAFGSVLKKSKFINEVTITSTQSDEQVLKLITKHCSRLKKISFNFGDISKNVLKQFSVKCGPNLRSIRFETHGLIFIENYKLLLRCCLNLEEVFNVRIDGLIDKDELLVTKLTKVAGLHRIDNKLMIQIFFDGCKNTLKSLDIDFEEVGERIGAMREISGLQNLEKLKLRLISDGKTDGLIADNMKAIAKECDQIKSLEMSLGFISSKDFLKIFDSIQYFTKIEHLAITYFQLYEEHPEKFSVKSLDGCKKLTHLKIKFSEINDSFFEGVQLYLPQLTHFNVGINNNISDETLHSLAKLQKLKLIRLENFQPISFGDEHLLITDPGICHFVNNCPVIESISFTRGPEITHKTIDALIGLALRKPRISFHHFFSYDTCSHSPRTAHFKVHDLPNNMELKLIQL